MLHIDSNDDRIDDLMNGSELPKINEEKDLGVVFTSVIKSSKNCSEVVIEANEFVGLFNYNQKG